MGSIKGWQNKKSKLIKRMIIVSIVTPSFLIAFFATANAVASLSDPPDCANGAPEFSLAVNGTMQTAQHVSLNLGPLSSSDSYCEVYTLTNKGNTPITVTATATVSPSSAAILKWQGGSTVTLSTGMNQKMNLTLTDFSAAGTASVSFSSTLALSVTIARA